jgi:hypothetical protein
MNTDWVADCTEWVSAPNGQGFFWSQPYQDCPNYQYPPLLLHPLLQQPQAPQQPLPQQPLPQPLHNYQYPPPFRYQQDLREYQDLQPPPYPPPPYPPPSYPPCPNPYDIYSNNDDCKINELRKAFVKESISKLPHIDLKLVRKPTKKDNRCYTCKPRGKVKKHIINTSESGKFYFHHDMHKRPIIIMTPSRHIESIDEMTQDEQLDFFKSLKKFTIFWDINDYQISYNSGKWQNHDHFHCKIRISEKIIDRMRRDHFKLMSLNSNYETSREIDDNNNKNNDNNNNII